MALTLHPASSSNSNSRPKAVQAIYVTINTNAAAFMCNQQQTDAKTHA
jgi:hypothetical protein